MMNTEEGPEAGGRPFSGAIDQRGRAGEPL